MSLFRECRLDLFGTQGELFFRYEDVASLACSEGIFCLRQPGNKKSLTAGLYSLLFLSDRNNLQEEGFILAHGS